MDSEEASVLVPRSQEGGEGPARGGQAPVGRGLAAAGPLVVWAVLVVMVPGGWDDGGGAWWWCW